MEPSGSNETTGTRLFLNSSRHFPDKSTGSAFQNRPSKTFLFIKQDTRSGRRRNMSNSNASRKVSSHIILPAWSLCQRELVRFVRQRSRMIGVIGSPLVFWFLIG